MPDEVVLHYRRTFDAPLPAAYAWLTDYQDDDPQRTTRIVKRRPVVSRSKDVVVLDGEIDVLGQRWKGRAEVHLFPPDRWEARFVRGDGRVGNLYEYRLFPEGPDRCRIEVAYRIRARRPLNRLRLTLFKPLIRREIHQMWDGFARSMAEDLRREGAVAAR